MNMEEFIKQTDDGSIFSVTFTKRTDGTLRTMVCRRGVSIGVKGVGMPYKPGERNLLTVFEMGKEDPRKPEVHGGQYRNIPLDAIISMRFKGKLWAWNVTTQEFDEIVE